MPSVFFGASTVYGSIMDKNISTYLNSEFVFPNTSLVKSSADKSARMISVSLVGTPISDDVISMLEQEMPKYGLDGYTLNVTQNNIVDAGTDEDSGDKITIALQENRINELERQLSEREQELSGLKTENSELKSTVDYAAVTAKAVKIFPELSNIRCGSVTDSSGEHALLLADSARPQDAAAQKLLENWLAAETGSSRAEVRVNVLEPEPATDETGTAEEGIPVE